MKTPQERARELYPFNEYSPDAEFDAYIKGHEEGKAEANAEWQEKMRWIPIEERLPTENKQYLVIQLNDMKRISVGTFNVNSKQFSLFGYHDHITHWKEII